jgi:cation:H+ antiporter
MLLNLLGLLVGLAGLYFGGEWLVSGASRLARSLGISTLIVGLTVVAIGTSAPELLVSVSAALAESPDIAIGNVVGSNIANIGLILGISGLIFPIAVHVKLLRREIPIMIGIAIIAFFLFRDGEVSRGDGVLLLLLMVAFIAFMIVSSIREQGEDDEPAATDVNRPREALRLVVGIAVLMVGAQFTVENASTIARELGISEFIIGVSLVAVGTSLPELVTSVTAALRKESDIAIGNVVGSNIFNLVGILGTTAVIHPIRVASQINNFDAFVMVFFSLLLIPFAFDLTLQRREAALFITGYVAYIIYTIVSGL